MALTRPSPRPPHFGCSVKVKRKGKGKRMVISIRGLLTFRYLHHRAIFDSRITRGRYSRSFRKPHLHVLHLIYLTQISFAGYLIERGRTLQDGSATSAYTSKAPQTSSKSDPQRFSIPPQMTMKCNEIKDMRMICLCSLILSFLSMYVSPFLAWMSLLSCSPLHLPSPPPLLPSPPPIPLLSSPKSPFATSIPSHP